jgi:hypothetical protein
MDLKQNTESPNMPDDNTPAANDPTDVMPADTPIDPVPADEPVPTKDEIATKADALLDAIVAEPKSTEVEALTFAQKLDAIPQKLASGTVEPRRANKVLHYRFCTQYTLEAIAFGQEKANAILIDDARALWKDTYRFILDDLRTGRLD